MRNQNLLFSILVIPLCCNVANCHFVRPIYAPIERLITNTSASIKENPDNAHGYYTLGRIHYLAFANRSGLVGAYEQRKPPSIAPDCRLGNSAPLSRQQTAIELTLQESGHSSPSDIPQEDRPKFWNAVRQKERQLREQVRQDKKLSDDESVKHAAAAVGNFKKAIALDPQNGLYHLGLASLLEQYVEFLTDTQMDTVPEEFRSIILDKAKSVYYTAYELSIRTDLEHKRLPIAGLQSLVGYEAGKAYVRLSEANTSTPEDPHEKLAKIRKNLQKLDDLPPGAITPIVFSLDQRSSLSDLLVPALRVCFDLDGDGLIEKWPWVKPTTGILVWDPNATGVITSGRQMFGSVSWWLFFEDGYQALDALDDSRDGVLSGHELQGISVWFDRDCNGKSRPGEVVRLEKLPIASLATKSTGRDNGAPMNISGLTLMDGRKLPTYDWVASPVELPP